MRAFARSVADHFAASWTATTIQYENVMFSPPSGAAWVRLNVMPAVVRQISLGASSVDREYGTVQVTVFAPLAQGTEYRDHLIDILKPIFRKRRIGGAQFETPDVSVDTSFAEPWFMASVRWRYWLDETTDAVLT